ncbi:hypothetical protein TGAM01_v200430 [Trichoderma gamsii]|uniref:Uncharacterized protein n=1 Tax=Trichoderma gamsii TaxID=398673 RepID=A0A2P5A399_9HYPO|nr:hypothetical protein TGAM01_v200430 [Trichoderma gamsii]PON31010.1 hypothetical protein TGAM01_v200430 [Trichoderma gamsii]
MSTRAIESRIAPPNLTIADIAIPKNEHTFGTFDQNSSSYEDALACLRMYRKQVTQLNYDERREIVHIITGGHFFRTRTAMKSPMCHKFYRYARASEFAAEHLSWPEYIIMRALYEDDLPSPYVSQIKQTFGTAAIEDFSYQFFEYFPEMNDSIAKPMIPTLEANIHPRRISLNSREASADDNLWPAPKRKKIYSKHEIPDTPSTVQKTLMAIPVSRAAKNSGKKDSIRREKATKQRASTPTASNAAAPEVTPYIDLAARDILDRLPSKTSGEGSKRIDKASWDRLQYLLSIVRETTIRNNIRLKALEESQRDLESKLGAMTSAFDTMNTTIKTIVTEARADREGYNHVLSSIKDIMMGMADSIKDIKEQL